MKKPNYHYQFHLYMLLIFADEKVANIVATPVPSPLTPEPIGNPVQFVNVPDVGVPRTGVTNDGLVANTNDPEPVSSVHAVLIFADEKVPNIVATPDPSPLTVIPCNSSVFRMPEFQVQV